MKPEAKPERGEPGDRVGGRSAARFARRAHRFVESRRFALVDQPHRPLGHALPGEERVVGVGDDIDDRIADGEHVEAAVGHESSGLIGKARA